MLWQGMLNFSLQIIYCPMAKREFAESFNENSLRSSFRSQSFVVHSEVTSVLKETSLQNKSQDLQLPNIEFVEESAFKKNPKCFVCEVSFGQLNRQHHCRVCGNSCCDLCSSLKINGRRSCDQCFLKACSASFEKRREKFLQKMKAHIRKLKHQIKNGQGKIEGLNNEMISAQDSHKQEMKRIMEENNDFQQQYTSKAVELTGREESLRALIEEDKKVKQEKENLQMQSQNLQVQQRGQDSEIYLLEQKLLDLKAQIGLLDQEIEQLQTAQIQVQEQRQIQQIQNNSHSRSQSQSQQVLQQEAQHEYSLQAHAGQLEATTVEETPKKYDQVDQDYIDEIMKQGTEVSENRQKQQQLRYQEQLREPAVREKGGCTECMLI